MQVVASECSHVPWRPTSLRKPEDVQDIAENCRGLEDARSFYWQGHVFLIGTVNEAVDGKGGFCTGGG